MSETLKMNTALILLNKRYWLAHFLIVAAICIAGLIYLGGATYMGSPPRVDFVSPRHRSGSSSHCAHPLANKNRLYS